MFTDYFEIFFNVAYVNNHNLHINKKDMSNIYPQAEQINCTSQTNMGFYRLILYICVLYYRLTVLFL